tara:strand:+ start:152 stop:604 length:453 start_codon:yes stop_codon:yes gene_type:complete
MKNRIFRVVTGVAGVYHILLAAAGFLCPADTVAKLVGMAFGIDLDLDADPQLALIVKFVSVYMLAFGVMLLVLSSNPIQYRAFAIPALVLFGLRLVTRILFFSMLTSAGMSVSRNVIGTGLIFIFFAAILFSLPTKQHEGQEHASGNAIE